MESVGSGEMNLNLDFFEMGLKYSKNESVKTLIDDVASILGYSHAEQVDMFF